MRATSGLEEAVQWGHLVYLSNGPVLLISRPGSRRQAGLDSLP